MSFKNVAILGSGSWGTALACLVGEKAGTVWLYGRDEKVAHDINHRRYNPTYLPGCDVPANVKATNTMDDLVDIDLLVFVVPSEAIASVAKEAASEIKLTKNAIILSCVKGIDKESGKLPSDIIKEAFPGHPLAVLSGPNHAEEVARKMATAAVIGCSDSEAAERLQDFINVSWFRAYTSDDIIGIEYGGAAKNVFAIAGGIADGLGLGDNAKAALVTRGLSELIRLGIALGGRAATFQGLSGVGDLIVTCYSPHSRNNRVGQMLGKGHSLEEISASMHMVAEGVPNAASLHSCAKRLNVDAPIIDQVHAILYKNKSPEDAMAELLQRDPKPESA